MLNRRRFNGVLIGGAGALLAPRNGSAQPPLSLPKVKSTFNGVVVGCNTYSLPQLSLDEAIAAMAKIGFGEAELHPRHVEPALSMQATRSRGGATAARPPATPEQPADAADAREKLRQWRLTVPLDQFRTIGAKFKDAGLYLYAYNMNYRDDFTDDEIDRTFLMTKALGCRLMTAVGSNALFRRLDPFAQKHDVRVGLHNEEEIRSVADFENVRKGLSNYIGYTLDIGHFVAYGGDPIAMLEKNHERIFNVHIKDRKKNNGPHMPFGEGDTPVKEVLLMLRDRKYRIPVNIEWEIAAGDRVDAVRRCLEYCKQVLQS